VRWLAGRWRSIRHASPVVVAAFLTAVVAWNLAIAWDFVQTGRRDGEVMGSTGRYVSSHRDVPDQMFYIASTTTGPWDYYSYGGPAEYVDRLRFFASNDGQVQNLLDPNFLGQFNGRPPFALFMRRDLWQTYAPELADRYPTGRIRNILPGGSHVVLEVPAA
jgi:hypothetical protein